MNLRRKIKEELNRTLRREGVKVVPKEGTPGPPCCCEEQFDPWEGSWECLQMGTLPGECCGSIQSCTGKGSIGEGVKVVPKAEVQACCCHTEYNPECGWDCVSGAIWHENCCPSKAGMVVPPTGAGEPMGTTMGESRGYRSNRTRR